MCGTARSAQSCAVSWWVLVGTVLDGLSGAGDGVASAVPGRVAEKVSCGATWPEGGQRPIDAAVVRVGHYAESGRSRLYAQSHASVPWWFGDERITA